MKFENGHTGMHMTECAPRLDAAIAAHEPDWPRAQIKRAIGQGLVCINGSPCTKSGRKLSAGDDVTWERQDDAPEIPPHPEYGIRFGIVYEDEHIFVLDKPAGLVVHPGSGNPCHTLVNGLCAIDPGICAVGESDRPGIVHRLDADTSGLLVVARSQPAYDALTAMFARHDIHRQYWAIACAPKFPDAGRFDTPYGRHPTKRILYTSKFDAPKRAVTRFRTVARTDAGYALVTCMLETGRTHQIRVHLSEHGAPILSDPLYAPKKIAASGAIARLALHAQRLIFRHPVTGEPCDFSAPFPDDFLEALKRLKFDIEWDRWLKLDV